jgi:aryl-alcohol dehydrogenase-like predicted oxidoreductase
LSTSEIPEYRSRTRHFNSATNAKSRHGEAGQEEVLFKTIGNLNKISEKHNISLADLAVAWPLHIPGVKCVIVGATKAE